MSYHKVVKQYHATRSSYHIIYSTGHGSYIIGKLHKPDSPGLKFIAYDLYPLLVSFEVCKHIDTSYTRYIN